MTIEYHTPSAVQDATTLLTSGERTIVSGGTDFYRPRVIWPVHRVAETWGAEFHPDLVLAGPMVKKGSNGEDGYFGFTTRDPETEMTMPTELAGILRDWSISKLVVTGLATDYCVKATALDGLTEGFDVVVLCAGVRSVDREEGGGDRALAEIDVAGGMLV